jgi:hypothetical protein
MTLIHRESKHGLIVAEESADEAAMTRALRRTDDRLRLIKEVDQRHGCFVWEVYCVVSDDQPAIQVCSWRDDYGTPLPLSNGLLDMVQSLRPENRGQRVDADEHNRKLAEERQRTVANEVDELGREWTERLDKRRLTLGYGGITGVTGGDRL